jgi:glutamate dehydrogenase
MPEVWAEVEALDNVVAAELQTELLLEGRKLVERASRWLLRNRPQPLDVDANVGYFTEGARAVAQVIPELIPEDARKLVESEVGRHVGGGVPEGLARRLALYNELLSALDIIEVATSEQLSVEDVSTVYFSLGEQLDLHWMRDEIIALPRENRWQTLARAALRDDLQTQERILTRDVLREQSQQADAASRIAAWMTHNAASVARCRQVLADLRSGSKTDFAMLSVAMREIRSLHEDEDTPERSEPQAVTGASRRKKAKPKGKSKGKSKGKAA